MKELRVGGFGELVFEVRIQFHHLTDNASHDAFLVGFVELIGLRQHPPGWAGAKAGDFVDGGYGWEDTP